MGFGLVLGLGCAALHLDLGDDVLALAHAVQVGEHRDGLARLVRVRARVRVRVRVSGQG